MPLRQSGEPVDLLAAVPKMGVINAGRYDEALRRRMQPIMDMGTAQTEFAVNQAEAAAEKRRQALMDRLVTSQRNAANSAYTRGSNNGYAAISGNVGSIIGKGGYVSPVKGYKPSGQWGYYPKSGGVHHALDYPVPRNTPVGSLMSGTVIAAGWDKLFGYHVRIKNANGTYTILAHLNSIGVKVGQRVGAGQYIGLSGSTGNSTGPHLHVEVRTDPYKPSTSFNWLG